MPDGQWVVFNRAGDKPTIWKVGINGGAPVQLTDQLAAYPVVSPDGKLIAYGGIEKQPGNQPRSRLYIIPFDGGPPVKVIDLPGSIRIQWGGLQWTADGRAICFVDTRTGLPNLWAQPIDGGPAKQLTNFKSEYINRYALSRDGKQIAVSCGSDTKDIVLIKNFR